jgi:hypothetical protein
MAWAKRVPSNPADVICVRASAGAIVNLWFPNWLLALIWVLAMLGSNIELLVSFIQYMRVKREAAGITARLRLVSPAASTAGSLPTPAGAGGIELTPAGDSSSPLVERRTQQQLQQKQDSSAGGVGRGELMRERQDLLERAQRLAKQAHKIEARALLYPTLYVPDVGKALKVRQASVLVHKQRERRSTPMPQRSSG